MSNNSKRVAFHTLGCKLNFTETSTIARKLIDEGYNRVEFEDTADIYVINTCSVTGVADKKCRQVVKKTIKKTPEAYIIVVGCYAQLKPEEITLIPGVDLVLGTNEKFNIASYIKRIEKTDHKEVYSCESVVNSDFIPSYSLSDRTRSFLKVQDGCDYPCSYCTIPLARGASRNQSISDCVEQAKRIADAGIKEIVITGVNIGDFGRSTGESFYDLLKALVEVEGVERYRISSIEPNLLTDEIIQLVAASSKILPHFHIPLQSGCNNTLRLMRRRYNRELFADRLEKVRSNIDDAGIGADIIVGFPGETEEDFQATRDFLEDCDLSYIHVFTYSQRSNTPAAEMPNQVPAEVKTFRSKILQRLSERKRLEFNRRSTGKSYNVLWEAVDENGVISGFTENYIRVIKQSSGASTGTISRITLLAMDENGIFVTK
jgi:threonylcarbamoyladenosine tRNA methylthiotransferase MtaB